MKRAATLLVIAACSSLFAAEPSELIHEAALGWMQGAVKQDGAALKRFLSDDLQYAHAGGQKQTKEQYIAAVTAGPARYESFTLSDLTGSVTRWIIVSHVDPTSHVPAYELITVTFNPHA